VWGVVHVSSTSCVYAFIYFPQPAVVARQSLASSGELLCALFTDDMTRVSNVVH
jgi:hypothetical protein